MYNEDLGFDDPDASKTAKIVFERALNYLRHGCVPVGVIDGQAPWQKLGALRARWGAHAGGGGGAFGRCGEVALEVLRALGLPGVEAPGEAEATCAVMDSMGIVDGCVTSDGDSLLFGARTVFKTLRLSHHDQRDLFMERVEAADVGKRLMLGDDVEHVAPALTTLALLTGGDYDLTGAKNVGGTKALLVVKALAKDEARRRALAGAAGRDRRDRTLPERLDRFLAAPPDPTIEALDKCTGCVRCKHDGCGKGKIKSHVRGCRLCGTEKGCVERDGECECPFHARADERWLHKVRERANATDGYARSFRDAARGYAAQARDAEEALREASDVEWVVDENDDGDDGFDSFRKMRWRRRPDVARLQALMETYCQWEPRRTREKLLPVLVEWDMKAARRLLRRVGGDASLASDPGRRWELLRRRGVEFVVERIAKTSGNNKAPPWRYLLEVNSADPAHWAAWQRAATGDPAAGESAPKGGTGVLPPNFHERGDDLAFLKALAQRRSVRMSLVRETCPHLVARFDAGGSKATSAPSTPAKAKSKPTTPRKTPKTVRGTKTRSPDQHDITSFFSQRRPTAPPAAPGTPREHPRPADARVEAKAAVRSRGRLGARLGLGRDTGRGSQTGPRGGEEAGGEEETVVRRRDGGRGRRGPRLPGSTQIVGGERRGPANAAEVVGPGTTGARFISEGAARGCPGVARVEVTVVLADEKGQAGDSVRVFEPQEGRDAVPAGDCGPVHAPEMNEMNESTR